MKLGIMDLDTGGEGLQVRGIREDADGDDHK
jgi:hypothetical protein